MTLTEDQKMKLSAIEMLRHQVQTLTVSEREEYERIYARLDRARADLRRATKRSDVPKIASAERAVARATAARDAFISPRVAHLRASAPRRIVARFEAHWGGPSTRGVHVQVCEMVLDHLDLSGPSYRTVRVVSDVGGPPTGAHGAPDSMGVAWFAIADQIARGFMTPIEGAAEGRIIP